jgi:hypothetical protein
MADTSKKTHLFFLGAGGGILAAFLNRWIGLVAPTTTGGFGA